MYSASVAFLRVRRINIEIKIKIKKKYFSKLFEFAGLSRLKTPIFVPKSEFSKKKKGLHLESVCKIPIFVPKSGCFSKKKKRSSTGIGLQNSYFRPKIRVFSKKKKVFNWNRSTKFLFSSQNHSVLQKKKLPLLVIDKTCAKLFRWPVVGPRCSMAT